MKNTRFKVAACLFGSVISAEAITTYTSGFEEPTFVEGAPGDPFPIGNVAGNDGWIINSGEDGVSFVQADGGAGFGNSQVGAIGGSIATPTVGEGANVNLTHAVLMPLTRLDFDVDFAVLGSSVDFPNIDNFGWSFLNDTTPLLRIAFEAPGGSGPGALEIAWYDNNGNRNLITPISQDIQYGSVNHLSIDFTPNGLDADFTATISSLNSFTFSGTLVGEGSTILNNFGADFDLAVAGDAGDNFMIFDNLSVVPEPSTSLFLFVSLAAFLRRRR